MKIDKMLDQHIVSIADKIIYMKIDTLSRDQDVLESLYSLVKANNMTILDLKTNNKYIVTYTSNKSFAGFVIKKPRKKCVSDDKIIQIAQAHGGFLTNVDLAEACGMSYNGLRTRLESDNVLKDKIEAIKEQSIDKIESTMYSLAVAGDTKAAKMLLDAHAKTRGYGSDVDKALDLSVKVILSSPSDGENMEVNEVNEVD